MNIKGTPVILCVFVWFVGVVFRLFGYCLLGFVFLVERIVLGFCFVFMRKNLKLGVKGEEEPGRTRGRGQI